MSLPCLLPQGFPDVVIDLTVGAFGSDMPMIIGPTANDRIKPENQLFLRLVPTGLDSCPHFGQERLRVLLRWFDERQAFVATDILTEEVEAFVDRGDLGFLGREPKPALVEKRFDQGTHLVFEQFAGTAGDDEVSRAGEFHPPRARRTGRESLDSYSSLHGIILLTPTAQCAHSFGARMLIRLSQWDARR